MKEIINITPKGIEYIDEEGKPQFIDFEACHQNFLLETEKGMGQQFEEHRAFYQKHKSVGIRYAFAKPPLIWFYTVPPITFEFPTPGSFDEVLYRIKKAGWRTTDGE